MRTWDERRPFLAVLEEDADVRAVLSEERLRACFDLDRALEHAGRTVDALDRLDPPPGAALAREQGSTS
jgi:adenylosuccinate lyase